MGCLYCGGEGVELGSLGWRTHFRCRDCGVDFSVDMNPNLTVPQKHQKKIEEQDARMPKAMRDVMSPKR